MLSLETTVKDIVKIIEYKYKEVYCFYQIEELFLKPRTTPEEIYMGIIQTIPLGMQYPDICDVKIIVNDLVYQLSDFNETLWVLNRNIFLQNEIIGNVCVYYSEKRPFAYSGPFSVKECNLIDDIAERLSRYLLYEGLKIVFKV